MSNLHDGLNTISTKASKGKTRTTTKNPKSFTRKEVWIPFDHVGNVTAQSVMADIQKVQQSNEEFGIED